MMRVILVRAYVRSAGVVRDRYVVHGLLCARGVAMMFVDGVMEFNEITKIPHLNLASDIWLAVKCQL